MFKNIDIYKANRNGSQLKGKKKVVVTGAAGFIGSHLVHKLLDNKYTVIGIDNFSSGCIQNIENLLKDENFTFVEGDVTDYNTCLKICDGANYVLHEAALNSVPRSIKEPLEFATHNNISFFNMLQASVECNIQRFVYASSSSVYGNISESHKKEENIGDVLSPYALSKRNNEEWAILYSKLYGINTIGLRYFNVFGPRQNKNSIYSAVIPIFINSLLLNKACNIFGSGEQIRDFTYIENVTKANLQAITMKEIQKYSVYNVAEGVGISINKLYYDISEYLGINMTPIYHKEREGDIKNSIAIIDKIQKELKYCVSRKYLEGLHETIEWYKEQL